MNKQSKPKQRRKFITSNGKSFPSSVKTDSGGKREIFISFSLLYSFFPTHTSSLPSVVTVLASRKVLKVCSPVHYNFLWEYHCANGSRREKKEKEEKSSFEKMEKFMR